MFVHSYEILRIFTIIFVYYFLVFVYFDNKKTALRMTESSYGIM